MLATYGIEFLLGNVGLALGTERPESILNLILRLNILRLSTDHEGHVLLETYKPVTVKEKEKTQEFLSNCGCYRIANDTRNIKYSSLYHIVSLLL